MHVLKEFYLSQLALIAPAPKLLNEFAQYLPDQKRWFGSSVQLSEQLLCLELLRWLMAIDGIDEDVRINGVHEVAGDSNAPPSSR